MNESADIVQEQAAEQLKTSAGELKEKARVAGAAAWDVTKATYQQVQEKAADCTRATDRAIRTNPYIALGCAFGIGMLIGALATRTKVVEKVERD